MTRPAHPVMTTTSAALPLGNDDVRGPCASSLRGGSPKAYASDATGVGARTVP